MFAFLWTSSGVRATESLVVASSLPKEVLVAYKKAFEQQNPQYRVDFVNFPATNIIPFLTDRNRGSRPDVFWSSSPDSFRALRRYGLLTPVEAGGRASIPVRIGNLDIDDADGF